MAKRLTKAERETETRVNALCSKALVGNPVSILDLPKVAKVAKVAIAEGKDDDGVLAALDVFIGTIRCAGVDRAADAARAARTAQTVNTAEG